MTNYDVTALGELLIDFTPSGLSAQGNPVLAAHRVMSWPCWQNAAGRWDLSVRSEMIFMEGS